LYNTLRVKFIKSNYRARETQPFNILINVMEYIEWSDIKYIDIIHEHYDLFVWHYLPTAAQFFRNPRFKGVDKIDRYHIFPINRTHFPILYFSPALYDLDAFVLNNRVF
jgi:hypothetical protein